MPVNRSLVLPYGLTYDNFATAAGSVDHLIHAMNEACERQGIASIESLIPTPATLSALISDVFAGALAAASDNLVVNTFHNGHPDLVPKNAYPDDGIQAGEDGIEVKATKNRVSDAHGARAGWWCQVRYVPADRHNPGGPLTYVHQICLVKLTEDDFRRNARMTDTGTRTATPAREAQHRLNESVVYESQKSVAA